MFKADLVAIDELRKEAVNVVEPHSSGIRKIEKYAAQLVFMFGKFPVDLGAEFVWYPSIGYHTTTAVSQDNLRFELANILFNLAALYCQLAVTANRSSADGLKSASKYFSQSAGVIAHLKTAVIPELRSATPADMEPVTLECLEQLLLAQAQECYWHKAVSDGLKDLLVSKLAAEVADLYLKAHENGIRSDTITSEWIHHMKAKQGQFASAAQYHAARDCLEKQKYGEEIARLEDSLACVSEALQESRYISKVVTAELNAQKDRVQGDLKRAERDNDKLWLVAVPSKAQLKLLDRASMVSSNIPKEISDPLSLLGEHGELGKPLFTKLVPYSVHIATSIYAKKRDATVDKLVEAYDALTTRIHNLLQSLNLPGSIQAIEKPLGLPPTLESHADEVRQQKGPQRIQRIIDEVDHIKSNCKKLHQQGVQMLQDEAREDEAARKKYGTERWTRQTSSEAAGHVYEESKKTEGYFAHADGSDEKVRKPAREYADMIRILSGTPRDLENFVPSSRRTTLTPDVEKQVRKLRDILNEVSRMETKRRRKIELLRSKAETDDVRAELIKEAARLEREFPMRKIDAEQFEDFLDRRTERYDSDRKEVNEERQIQADLLSRVAEANTSFKTIRSGDSSTKEREQALQKLENAYFAYKELVQNLEVGRKWYTQLSGSCTTFRDDCRSFVYQRRAEAKQLEAEMVTALPMANLSLGAEQALRQGRTQQQERSQADLDAQNAQHENIAAPVAVKPGFQGAPVTAEPGVRTWAPDAGIRFAPGAPSPGRGSEDKTQAARQTTWDPSKGLRFNRAT